MKLYRTLFISIALLMLQIPAQSQNSTASTITEVDVYASSARVTREAEVKLEAGENVLRFTNLPSGLHVNQIQVALLEGANVRLDNLKYQIIAERQDTAEEIKLQKAIKTLSEQIEVLKSDKKDQASRIHFAQHLSKSFTNAFGEHATEAGALERASEVLEFQQKTLSDAQVMIRGIEDQLIELEKKSEELSQNLTTANTQANRLQGEVTLRLFAAAAGDVKLTLNYLIPKAKWFPSYAVRVNSSTNSMKIAYQANISQNSGENWDDVVVNISTSQPDRSGNVPTVQPVYLQATPSYYLGKNQEFDPFGNNRNEQLADARKAPLDLEETTVQVGMASFSATLPSKIALASGSEPSRFPILSDDFEAKFWSEIVPAVQEKGFLKTETTNAFDLPLIPGQAQVFIDGALTSRVSVPYAIPGDNFELSLGVDDFIIVKRKETVRETEYAGLIDKTTVLKRAYTIEVTNFHPLKHEVKVFEQFPISRNEKIMVKRQLPSVSAIEIDKDTGVFFWKEILSAQALKEYKLEFEVVHPREWNLNEQI